MYEWITDLNWGAGERWFERKKAEAIPFRNAGGLWPRWHDCKRFLVAHQHCQAFIFHSSRSQECNRLMPSYPIDFFAARRR
jgi:hypothetical protein